jgi:LL-diaminopimelate aminotransferase
VDTNVMNGNTGAGDESGRYEGITYLPCTEANGFMPDVPAANLDLIYICSPNNPTGAAITREKLEAWVQYALKRGAVILFDAAYEAFIVDPALPKSIYEIPGARECAIEFRSFSKHGGFTGVRCAFTVVPKDLKVGTRDGAKSPLYDLWSRRMTTKFNGASYIVQKGAAALFSDQGKQEVEALISHYLGNAKVLRDAAAAAGLQAFGGENAPYIWVRTPSGQDSWKFFDVMLKELNVVITPGAGFGAAGQGYFRISAFNSRENVIEVGRRLQEELKA